MWSSSQRDGGSGPAFLRASLPAAAAVHCWCWWNAKPLLSARLRETFARRNLPQATVSCSTPSCSQANLPFKRNNVFRRNYTEWAKQHLQANVSLELAAFACWCGGETHQGGCLSGWAFCDHGSVTTASQNYGGFATKATFGHAGMRWTSATSPVRGGLPATGPTHSPTVCRPAPFDRTHAPPDSWVGEGGVRKGRGEARCQLDGDSRVGKHAASLGTFSGDLAL